MTEKRQAKNKKLGEHKILTPRTTDHNIPIGAPVPMHDLLGDKLRAYYNEVASEPVPDRFEKLLEELAARTDDKKPN
jgi:Anti-sigma factor NepR